MKQQREEKLGQDYSLGALTRKQAIKIHKGLKGQIALVSLYSEKGRLVGMHKTQICAQAFAIHSEEKLYDNNSFNVLFQIIITKTIDVVDEKVHEGGVAVLQHWN